MASSYRDGNKAAQSGSGCGLRRISGACHDWLRLRGRPGIRSSTLTSYTVPCCRYEQLSSPVDLVLLMSTYTHHDLCPATSGACPNNPTTGVPCSPQCLTTIWLVFKRRERFTGANVPARCRLLVFVIRPPSLIASRVSGWKVSSGHAFLTKQRTA